MTAQLSFDPSLKPSLRKRFFSRPLDGAISLIGLAVAAWVLWHLFTWAVLNAVWSSPDGTSAVCRDIKGACWAVINVRWRLIMFGLFPYEEQWRSTLQSSPSPSCLACHDSGRLRGWLCFGCRGSLYSTY